MGILPKNQPSSSGSEVTNELFLLNDDKHTFNEVIDIVSDVCGHDLIQSEQCVLLTHYVGACCIKKGSYDELYGMKIALSNLGLNVEIK